MINCPSCEYADFDKDKCKRLLIRLPHVCPYAEERKPRNHFEKIKAMSMDEMAKLLDNARASCGGVMGGRNCMADCRECWLDWLKEEITDVKTE